MSNPLVSVYIHPSQFPDRVYQNYLDGFSTKEIDNRFHYDSVKQSQKWLKIHAAYSPASLNQDCIQVYDYCFKKTATLLENESELQLIALGCGGGAKDSRLLTNLLRPTRNITCYPIDVSLSLALISGQAMKKVAPNASVKPIVCDLIAATDLINSIDTNIHESQKIITFFGMIPNFYPDKILPILSSFIKPNDILLFSANLSPGTNYLQGIQQVLPQYDNELTKDWLMTILIDAGVEKEQGVIFTQIESDDKYPELSRITFYFDVKQEVNLRLDERQIHWQVGEKVRLFFSYRYTTGKLHNILNHYGINVIESWEDKTQQEGVYLCGKEGKQSA